MTTRLARAGQRNRTVQRLAERQIERDIALTKIAVWLREASALLEQTRETLREDVGTISPWIDASHPEFQPPIAA